MERQRSRTPRFVAAVSRDDLIAGFRETRRFSESLCDPLAPEDCVVQTMEEVSPTKWHLAHTSWFFETFVLKQNHANYRSPHTQYAYLFNSYYNQVGPMHSRPRRGLMSRPTLAETYDYRRYVDEAVAELLMDVNDEQLNKIAPVVILGIHHEQQHQELILTDIKHVLAQNPLRPAYKYGPDSVREGEVPPMNYVDIGEGIYRIGHDGGGFAYDNESPRHRILLEAYRLGDRLITNGEYLAFIEDGGYQNAGLWLSLGWDTVRRQDWNAPLYWERHENGWKIMTLSGLRDLDPSEPVTHVSYFEAEAFARWYGSRLPTEAEWEVAAESETITGHFVDRGRYHPAPLDRVATGASLSQLYGDVWEWTQSHYSPYPGYQPPAGAIGEYNGKFMCNQFVLRGGSCATSRSHIRGTYRNFFPPDARWQFTGIRLVQDA